MLGSEPGAPEETGGPLIGALRERLLAGVDNPLLRNRTACVVLRSDDETVTIALDRGRLRAHPGAVPLKQRATTVMGSQETLRAIVLGQETGVGAFLDGRVAVRGDLSLALALDGLFDRGVMPEHWPHATMNRPRGIGTAYLDAGPVDAPVVVLLHGLGATNASMLPLMWELASDHRVLAPDLPGFGGSARPHSRYDAAWYTSWLTSWLDDLDVDDAVIIGNSMGGRIALEAGLRAPDRVRALILLSPSPAFRRLRQWVPIARLLRPEAAMVPLPVPHAMVVESIRAMFSDPDRIPPHWLQAGADEFLRVFHTRSGRVAFMSCLRQIYLDEAYGERGFWERLPRLTAPALFVWGDRDRLVPAAFSRHVATALPEAGSIVLEDCGHVPQFEHPVEVAAMVRGFLEGLEEPAH